MRAPGGRRMGVRPPGGRQGEGSRRASDGGEGVRGGLQEGLLRVLNLKYREFQISYVFISRTA